MLLGFINNDYAIAVETAVSLGSGDSQAYEDKQLSTSEPELQRTICLDDNTSLFRGYVCASILDTNNGAE